MLHQMNFMENMEKTQDFVCKEIGICWGYTRLLGETLASCEEAHEGPHVSSLRLNGGRRPGNSIRAREGRTSKTRERIDTI